MINIYVACDGDWDSPEVQISGASRDLSEFGLLLKCIDTSKTLTVLDLESEFYPICVKTISLECISSGNKRLTVMVDASRLNLVGTSAAFKKLGESLVDFFDEKTNIGEHFHLDYYEENEILNETNCHLIFLCDR